MAGLAVLPARRDRVFVADIYDPMHLEQLEQARDDGERVSRRAPCATPPRCSTSSCCAATSSSAPAPSSATCGSVTWRRSGGSTRPPTTPTRVSTRSSTSCPSASPTTRPSAPAPASGASIPGVGADDPVILWGGGVYNWFDPLTLIRAIDQLRTRRPDVRLVFLGMRHPNPDIPEMRMAVEARRLADELGLTACTSSSTRSGWPTTTARTTCSTPMSPSPPTSTTSRPSSRSAPGCSTTCGRPADGGDQRRLAGRPHRAQRARAHGAAQDAAVLAEALFTLLDDKARAEACRENIREVVPELVWARTLQPLVEFCRAPRRAPDLMEGLIGDDAGPHPTELTPAPRGLRADVALVVRYLREGGPVLLLTKVREIGATRASFVAGPGAPAAHSAAGILRRSCHPSRPKTGIPADRKRGFSR